MAIRPELRAELLTLPAQEREELADQLYESLEDEPRDPGWEEAWGRSTSCKPPFATRFGLGVVGDAAAEVER